MSQETMELHEKRRKAYSKKKPTPIERKKWNRKISRSCRNDYRKWVTKWTEEIEKEFRKGNAKAIYAGVRQLCGTKKSFATKQPTKEKKTCACKVDLEEFKMKTGKKPHQWSFCFLYGIALG